MRPAIDRLVEALRASARELFRENPWYCLAGIAAWGALALLWLWKGSIR